MNSKLVAVLCTVGAVVAASADLSSDTVLRGAAVPQTAADQVLRVPSGFEWFEPALRARLSSNTRMDDDIIECSKIPEPSLPTRIPDWGTPSVDALRQQGVHELHDTTLRKVGAFIMGREVVIKECSTATLEHVIEHILPHHKLDPHPQWDVYFACGDAQQTFTITVRETLAIGRGSRETSGAYRIMAVDRNVVLDGDGKVRIMSVRRHANLTVYGLTFQRGLVGNNYARSLDGLPSGGWNGAGILVLYKAVLTAYECRFLRNTSEGLYARWSGGAAVKLETGSYGSFWGCDFEGNDAAVGGALATSSAVVLHVSHSRFLSNVARGGLDDNGESRREDKHQNPLKDKRVILARGGALRVDSAQGADVIKGEHVMICNSEFTGNKIVITNDDLVAKFGYDKDDLFYVRGAGMAVTMWNSPRNMADPRDNQHFVSIKGCVFQDNHEGIEPQGDWLGRYVVEWMGAGHCKIEDCEFRDNKVNRAVLKVDNSRRWRNTVIDYGNILKDLSFVNNGGDVYNIEFKYGKNESKCTFWDVDGVPDEEGDCNELLQASVDSGNNESIINGDSFDDPLQGVPTPTLPPAPEPTAMPTSPPDFLPCNNEWSTPRCEALRDGKRGCGHPSVASSCRLTCGMCEVCVDFDDETCFGAKLYGWCSTHPEYASNCPASCGLCSATPTPTPTPFPTPAEDFVRCKDARGRGACKELKMKGLCNKDEVVARDCALSCGYCPTCVDFHPEYCAHQASAADDGCSLAVAEVCPKSCNACK